MAETFFEKYRVSQPGVEFDGFPLPKGGGTNPNIDHKVKNRSYNARDVLRLAWGDISKVDPAKRSAGGA
jgi:hypothetical protein